MYSNKTTIALKAIIKFCYFALAIVTVFLWAVQFFGAHGVSWIDGIENRYYTLLCSFSLVVPAGYVALAYIDRLLTNVQKDRIFEIVTTRYLDKISYCCVYAGIIGIGAITASLVQKIYYYAVMFFVLMLGELFMALLLKVIKKIFAKAIEIKDENDLTV
ncbi:DUF2975 domain-containing protein [uncultured Eubacterium sp.]|uniref:DUF2975 domain-containing protein n=1 Tax=uncultured Eubacterium sp. TaxID=165185 RepID=UPI0015BF15B7|nr:DUF2975 domain-containing protein [uncultured Eubacterium sp.]